MNEIQVFFFVLLPTALIIMGIVLALSIRTGDYGDTGPQQKDTFEEMSDED